MYADYDLHDYCNLKMEVVISKREYLSQRSVEVDLDEDLEKENPEAQRGEPTSNTEEDPEEDLEEDPEENPDENVN